MKKWMIAQKLGLISMNQAAGEGGGEGAGGSGDGETPAATPGINPATVAAQFQKQTPAAPADGQAEPEPWKGPDGKVVVEKLPPDVQALIKDLREENANRRTTTKTAAETAIKALAKELGIEIPGDEPSTPEQLAEKLKEFQDGASQKDAAIQEQAVQLAIYKTSAKHGANPDALVDSRAFLANVSKLDHTASDFEAKVIDAAKKAVESNSALALVQAGASAIDLSGGTGERPKQSPTLLGAVTKQLSK